MSGRRLLIGLGNELRGDDAAGLLVAREARASRDEVEVLELDGEPVDLIDAWEGAAHAVLVDAVAPHSPAGAAGTLHRFDAAEGPLPAALAGPSTHALGLVEAIELGRALGRLPGRLLVLGIEGERFEYGAAPSPAVLAAIAPTAREALRELTRT